MAIGTQKIRPYSSLAFIFPRRNQRRHDQPGLRSHGQGTSHQHHQSYLLDYNLHSYGRSSPILMGAFVKQIRPTTCAFGNDASSLHLDTLRDRTPYNPRSWKKFILPPLQFTLKPHTVFPALNYATQYGYASVLSAVTVASTFSKEFKWDTLQIRLGYGGSLTIGGSLGELAAGLVLDALVQKKRRGNVLFQREMRLRAIWHGAILVPAGLLTYGSTMQYKTT